MIEPLPKARSICDSAASIAFDFSLSCMGELSTNLSADCDMATVLMAEGNSDSQSLCRGFMYPVCSHAQGLFSVLCWSPGQGGEKLTRAHRESATPRRPASPPRRAASG